MNENSRNYEPIHEYVPQCAIDAIARRFAMGAKKHGEWSWKHQDKEFYRDRAVHAIKHIENWLAGDETDPDNLAGAICDIAIVIYHDEKERVIKQWAESEGCKKLGDS